MKAKGWKGATYGIRVGRANARKFFGRDWKVVEVDVGGRWFRFKLSETFWTTCPELRGKDIGDWLKIQGLAPWPHGRPPHVELVPLHGNRFRLRA